VVVCGAYPAFASKFAMRGNHNNLMGKMWHARASKPLLELFTAPPCSIPLSHLPGSLYCKLQACVQGCCDAFFAGNFPFWVFSSRSLSTQFADFHVTSDSVLSNCFLYLPNFSNFDYLSLHCRSRELHTCRCKFLSLPPSSLH
jgi:hypothetical protein